MIDFKDYMVADKLKEVDKVIIIGSGKGGVGKSTITSLLGLRLRDLGMDVGILDTDLHGSSIPFILGGDKELVIESVRGGFKPIELHRIKVMSLRMFVGDRPTPLRGERKSEILKYMLSLTVWGPLDYLLVDLPPGMSDELLTLMKYVKGKHIVVTLPTKTSLDVALRYVSFLNSLNYGTPIILVNNLMNINIDHHEVVSGFLNEPPNKYFIMPYIHGIEEHLYRGILPVESVKIIDKIIECLHI